MGIISKNRYVDVGFMLYDDDWDHLLYMTHKLFAQPFWLRKPDGQYGMQRTEFGSDTVYRYRALVFKNVFYDDRYEETKMFKSFIKSVPHALIVIGEDPADIYTEYETHGDNNFLELTVDRKILLKDLINRKEDERWL